jgi:hypothetical protein
MIISVQLIRRTDDSPNRVIINGTELFPDTSQLVYSHRSNGFDWGYHGSGPAHTALGICLHLFGPHIAPHVYQSFKVEHVASWSREGFYTVDVTGFYKEFVEPNMPDYLAEWMDFVLNQLMVATDEKAFVVTDTIDQENWCVKFEVKEGVAYLRPVCEPLGYTLVKLNGVWFVTAKFPLTDSMVGLVIDSSTEMFSTAVEQFTDVLGTAAKNISKIA